jgi:hypothetical protein
MKIEVFYDWIVNHLEKGKTILELGSGETTIKLCEDYTVHSIEHDAKFVGLAEKSNYIHAPIKQYKSYRWYDVDEVKKVKNLQYDFILVDGPTGVIGREGFLHNIELFNTDVPILVDDTNRRDEMILANLLTKKLGKTQTAFGGPQKNFIVLT